MELSGPHRQVHLILRIDPGSFWPLCSVLVIFHSMPLQRVATECLQDRATLEADDFPRALCIFQSKSRILAECFQLLRRDLANFLSLVFPLVDTVLFGMRLAVGRRSFA